MAVGDGISDLGGGDIHHLSIQYLNSICRVFVEKILLYLCQVMSGSRKDCDSELFKDCSIFPPAADVCKVVCSHYEGEGIVRLAFFQGSQSSDCIVRLRHIQFDVIDLDFAAGLRSEVAADSFYSSIVAVLAGRGAYAVLERVLRGYYEIDHIKTGLLDHMLDDGEVADMQWVE